MTADFYDLLDVPTDASEDEIREAFRQQVRIYHPDLNDDERAQAQFTALKTAYDVLGDPVERRAYDRLGHRDYVAKRTSGLPSPDQWQTKPKPKPEDRSGIKTTADSTGATSSGESWVRGSSGQATAESSGGHGGNGAGTTSGTQSVADATGDGFRSQSTASAPSGTAAGHTGVDRRRSPSWPFADSALVRWWRSKNFAWPLLWAGTVLYLVGLVFYASRNDAALRTLAADLHAVGIDPGALWSVLSSGRYGLETGFSYVRAVGPVVQPVGAFQWYALLGAITVLPILALIVVRLRWRGSLLAPVTIDETMVLAVAIGLSSGLFGGPVLAGSILLPLLYGVVIYHTQKLPGWSPSYVYVVAVSAPAVALCLGATGYASLPIELVAFVILPLAGALGLPVRVAVRRRFGV